MCFLCGGIIWNSILKQAIVGFGEKEDVVASRRTHMVKLLVHLLRRLIPSDKAALIAARDSTPVAFGGCYYSIL
jgi:hypothetical protein